MNFSRNLFLMACLFLTLSVVGCGGEPPAEASGEPVPIDYADQQQEAQQKAMEDAMKNRGKKK